MRLVSGITLPAAAIVKRGAWGMPDQAFISLSNFVTTILLARALSPDRFGEFAVAFSFITVAMALAAGALTQPFIVLSARYEGTQYKRYLTSTLLAHCLFITAVVIPIGIGSIVAAGLGWRLASLMAIVIPAFAAWKIQEFIRQVFYTENRLKTALVNDVISYGGQMAGFVIAFATDTLTSVSGLAILAGTSLLAIFHGLWLLRDSLDWSLSRQDFRTFMAEAWDFGRWTFGFAAIASFTGFLILLMLATLAGAAAAGALRAFVTTTAPMRILIAGAKTSFGPSAAQIAEREGNAGLQSHIRHIFLLVGPIIAAYCLLVVMLAKPLLNLLYGGSFDDYAWLLPVFIAAYFITEIFFAVEIGLRAQRVTDVLFRASLIGAIGTWILGPPMAELFGLSGLLWLALALAPISGVMMWLRYQRELHGEGRLQAPLEGRDGAEARLT